MLYEIDCQYANSNAWVHLSTITDEFEQTLAHALDRMNADDKKGKIPCAKLYIEWVKYSLSLIDLIARDS